MFGYKAPGLTLFTQQKDARIRASSTASVSGRTVLGAPRRQFLQLPTFCIAILVRWHRQSTTLMTAQAAAVLMASMFVVLAKLLAVEPNGKHIQHHLSQRGTIQGTSLRLQQAQEHPE